MIFFLSLSLYHSFSLLQSSSFDSLFDGVIIVIIAMKWLFNGNTYKFFFYFVNNFESIEKQMKLCNLKTIIVATRSNFINIIWSMSCCVWHQLNKKRKHIKLSISCLNNVRIQIYLCFFFFKWVKMQIMCIVACKMAYILRNQAINWHVNVLNAKFNCLFS